MSKKNNNADRNLIYNRNEKRVNDTYAKHNQNGEDSTKYGEFVSSFHKWLPIEEQKDIAKDLEDVTKE